MSREQFRIAIWRAFLRVPPLQNAPGAPLQKRAMTMWPNRLARAENYASGRVGGLDSGLGPHDSLVGRRKERNY